MKLADLKKITNKKDFKEGYLYLWVGVEHDVQELCLTYYLSSRTVFDLTRQYTLVDVDGVHVYPSEQETSRVLVSEAIIEDRLADKHCYEIGPFDLLIDFEERLLGAIEDFDVQPRNRK